MTPATAAGTGLRENVENNNYKMKWIEKIVFYIKISLVIREFNAVCITKLGCFARNVKVCGNSQQASFFDTSQI